MVATSGSAPAKATKHLQDALASIKHHQLIKSHVSPLNTPGDFRKLFWQFRGSVTGFKGYLNRFAGYAHSSGAMEGIHQHLCGRGVKFILGSQHGKVDKLVYEGSGVSRHCTAIETADGIVHKSALVVSCLGAFQAEILPQVGSFSIAKSWSVAHIQLTRAEADLLRGIPVLNVRDLGFFFEPDPETKLFKICPLGAGYINTDRCSGISLPLSDNQTSTQDYIPGEDERKMRQLLKETLPWLAERPFVDKKMCWFADTADSEYCIDFVPETNRSVIVMTGDSGHGFKMMPIAGSWVLDLLKNGQQELARWQFRNSREQDLKDWGDAVSWRIGTTKEIRTVLEEEANNSKARL